MIKAPSQNKKSEFYPFVQSLKDKYNITEQFSTEASLISAIRSYATAEEMAKVKTLKSEAGVNKDFKGGHFEERNVLAHVRTTDRKTPDGKKVLFVEEMQSDWAKEGRKHGFKQDVSNEIAEAKKIIEKYRGETITFNKNLPKYQQIDAYSDDISEQAVKPSDQDTVRDDLNRLDELSKVIYEGDETTYKVPSHPYLKNWQENTVKQIIKQAVNEGYDYVSFISGEQTADRYDLSKHIDTINTSKGTNGKYSLQATKGGNVVIDKSGLSENELSELIGKDLSKKVIENKDVQAGIVKTFPNQDLKVGGKWAKNLYDVQIPSILKKLGAEVEKINLGVEKPSSYRIGQITNGEWAIFTKEDRELKTTFKTKEEALDWIGESKQISIKITPKLRTKVFGQPKAGGTSGGAFPAAESGEERGYGTVEASEKKKKERGPKTDYSQVSSELPTKDFNVIDEALKIVSPAARSGARVGAKVLRKNLADLAHNDVVVSEALQKIHRAFTWMNLEDSLKFIDDMENGRPQATRKLQKTADLFRKMLDDRKERVQNLGKGHLESFYENYFPHIWKDPQKSKNVIGSILGKKRIEGSKAFLKERKIMTIKDGINRKLELVSENPADLVMLKLHEMDRYIMAQNIIKDLKEKELLKFVYSRNKTPDGYKRIDDNAFTVFMPPEITKKEAYDVILVEQLINIATTLGIDMKRFVSIGGKRLGYATVKYGQVGGEKIRTKYATPESVVAHEIGHVLGTRYKLFDLFRRTNDGEWKTHTRGKKQGEDYFVPTEEAIEHRKNIDKQWRALADARGGRSAYVRNAREKEAVMLQAMIHAPEEFKKIAPDLYKMFRSFLNSHSELRPILDVKPSLVLGGSDAKIKVPGFTTLGFFVAPEEVALILNNYLSPGLKR